MRYLVLVLSVLVLISCKEEKYAGFAESDSNSGLLGLLSSVDSGEDYVYENPQALSAPPPTPAQEVSQKIIKTANLRYETQDLDKTRQQVASIIKDVEGYIQNDNSGTDYNQLYQRLTIRVPTKNFKQALDGIAQGVTYFDERTISQKDVTEEFVDLTARLKSKRALENRYLALLTKANDVKEMLEIERALAQIREEIEAKEGRLNYLNDQVSLSTIYIHFYKVTADRGVTQSYGSKMSNAFKSGWNGISIFFLGLLHIWPFLILLGIGIFLLRRWVKRRKKQKVIK